MDINNIIQQYQIINLYMYGSRVYGCNNINSDYDYIAIANNYNDEQIIKDNINITFYTIDKFQNLINKQEISALECLFLSDQYKIQEKYKFKYIPNKLQLRKSISSKASNSFVKCKKKLTILKDYDLYIGKKSLFHSLRILLFGIQIAKYNKIVDYTIANKYLKDILLMSNDWNIIKNKYQPIYNKLYSQFKELAPKEEK